GVVAGAYVTYTTGAPPTPAVTGGLCASANDFSPAHEDLGLGVSEATAANALVYFLAQMIGAFLGAVVMYLAYKKHFDEEAPAPTKLAGFSTGPEIRTYGWNFVTEVVGTFVLLFVIVAFGFTPSGLGPLALALDR